jgi:hypothetical protein
MSSAAMYRIVEGVERHRRKSGACRRRGRVLAKPGRTYNDRFEGRHGCCG